MPEPDEMMEATARLNEGLRLGLHRLVLAVVALVLVGGIAGGPTSGWAQVQIEQVEPVTSQIEEATQGQVVMSMFGDCKPAGKADCENVSRSDVLGLIPGSAPLLPNNTSGNSAVIVQRGDNNDAMVNQQGSENEASITQWKGNGNEATVEQGPSTKYPGQNNLAVIVQEGWRNQTTIRQLGEHNIAGIKLDGSNNGIALEQQGGSNEYLLEFTGSGLGGTRSSTTHEVSQIGSNNRLVQTGKGSTPFNVRQRGDGMHMVIRHNAP